ncbi:unnamed protein product [Symbiodinium natans]|uniref:Uncharacterized protein n=1 Tax=Symbiodinium natans TaxID=878477 RepID=A0A812P068_9DINO|nr:unnamed protein product [Symbiodinium natans]
MGNNAARELPQPTMLELGHDLERSSAMLSSAEAGRGCELPRLYYSESFHKFMSTGGGSPSLSHGQLEEILLKVNEDLPRQPWRLWWVATYCLAALSIGSVVVCSGI